MMTFLQPNKKITFLLLGLFFTTVLVYPNLTYAVFDAVASAIQGTLYFLVTTVFGFLAWCGGLLLNDAISSYVVGFGTLFETSGLGYSVNSLWTVVRDIFNLTFIFGLVYIGFKMILNSEDTSAKKMLGTLVIAALLVNFSLFFTKIVIDFSNIAAAQFAQAFGSGAKYAVSDGFMKLLGVSSMWETSTNIGKLDAPAGFAHIFGSLFLYLTIAFVFAAGGILLIIRFVVLNFYMILSPLMFLGFVFPGLANISKTYWEGFLGRAFFAPAYLLMLYFSHQILVNMKGVVTAGSKKIGDVFTAKDAAVAANSFEGTIMFYILTCVFLMASLVIAQKMGAVGASNAVAIGKRFAGATKNAALAPVRKTGRFATGWAARGAEKANDTLQTTGTGRGIKRALSIVTLGGLSERERLAAIDAGKSAKFGGKYSWQDDQDFGKKTQQRENNLIAENNRKTDYAKAQKILNDTTTVHSATDLNDALDQLAKAMRDMTKEEKEKMSVKELTNKTVAVNLSESDIENLDKSGKFGSQDIKNIKAARSAGFKSIAAAGNTLTNVDAAGNITSYSHVNAGSTVPGAAGAPAVHTPTASNNRRAKVAAIGTKEVGKLPIEIFKSKEMYAHITPAMLEERMRNGFDPATDLTQMRKALSAHLGIVPPAVPAAAAGPWFKWYDGNSTYAAQFFA